MRKLLKILKYEDMLLETNAKIIYTVVFPVIVHDINTGHQRKLGENSFEMWCWRRAL